MDYQDYLTELRRELDAFSAVLDGDLHAPVEHCGDWTLFDLVAHMGAGNLWVATAVREGHGEDYDEDAAPREQAAPMRRWDAEDLSPMLWARKPRDTDSIAWTGDREAGMRVLAGPLVP